jgi:membrane-associated phospholipid phosphatase
MLEIINKNKFWLFMSVVVVGLGIIFLKLVDNYVDSDGLLNWDRPVNLWVETIRTPFLNKLMLLMTVAGDWQIIAWGMLLGVILLIKAQKHRYLLALILSNSVAVSFIEITKFFFSRVRPSIDQALILENNYSFPSGHSYFAVVFYGLVIYFWFRHFKETWKRITILLIGGTFVVLLALSRIYLGVHWLTDVLAGLTASGVWLTMVITYMEYKIKFFKPEHRDFNRKTMWWGFWIFTILWMTGWFWMFSQKVGELLG